MSGFLEKKLQLSVRSVSHRIGTGQKKPWVSIANSKRIGKLHPLFGTHRSSDTKLKISISKIGISPSKESSIMGGINRSGSKHHAWNGGQLIDKDGYIRIKTSEKHPSGVSKYKLEHRIVVEPYLGRLLKPEEDVHHRNEIRTDNKIQNLMVFVSRSAHRRYEMGGKYEQSEIVFDGSKLKCI